jgi:hypothetical protein
MKRLFFNAFVMNTSSHIHHGQWRRPDARQVATLDHVSKGRAAWNIVTGTQDNGYRNFGYPALEDHDERYRWADEYVGGGALFRPRQGPQDLP